IVVFQEHPQGFIGCLLRPSRRSIRLHRRRPELGSIVAKRFHMHLHVRIRFSLHVTHCTCVANCEKTTEEIGGTEYAGSAANAATRRGAGADQLGSSTLSMTC